MCLGSFTLKILLVFPPAKMLETFSGENFLERKKTKRNFEKFETMREAYDRVTDGSETTILHGM